MKAITTLCVILCLAPVRAATPSAGAITLQDFKLVGDLSGDKASFVLTATAWVEDSKGGTLELLAGPLALTEPARHSKWRIEVEANRYRLVFERRGKFPIQLKFDAAIKQRDTWKSLDFAVAPGVLQPIVLKGLGVDTKFEFAGAARPQRQGSEFASFLPSDGAVKLSWKEARPEVEGKLFYAAEMLSQISVSPGLMRQAAFFDCKVMQGELSRVTLRLHGAGEVTRVQGEQVLAWNVENAPDSSDRRLVVQFNQPQKEQFSLQVQVETPLVAFPQTMDAMQLRPEGATRFAGYFRIVNEGAVRLEVAQATGLSQISPDQFPESDATRALRASGTQRFAYRFSSAEFGLRIQADQILPELSVSEVVDYHLGENELAINAEMEIDVREAPLRELTLRLPKGYSLARLNASGLTDYFLREPEKESDAELRLVYGQPVSGRQVVQLRLERNQPLGETSWTLARLDVPKAKSVRGNVGVGADAGFRLALDRTQGVTETATAFFPRKVANLQVAFRLSDASWQATLRVERMPQTVQADGFHLFSVGEGVAYGSSVINYVVSGAPVSAFKVELSDEYFNVEFTGKDVRNWQKVDGGYLVQLHTPVSGAYTLLATYERPFKSQGETLAFTGARSLDAQSEQGYTLVISTCQFQVKPADLSPGLLALEPGEVPPEYRLFFDAPILAAYRYTSRPFSLKLALSPLAQGDSLSQVVDRASLITHISKEGQALTDVRYYIKNRGNPNFRLTIPPGTTLWSVNVNGAPVVPVTDAQANLIPLPQGLDPNAVLTVELKLAAGSKNPGTVTVGAPSVGAPVMLAEWKLQPDTGQRLLYRQGSLTPLGGVMDASGFAQLMQVFTGEQGTRAVASLVMGLVLLAAAVLLWRWAGREGVYRFSAHHLAGTLAGTLALVLAAIALCNLWRAAQDERISVPGEISLLAPVQQANTGLMVEVGNLEDKASALGVIQYAWPVILALVVWVYALVLDDAQKRLLCRVSGWMLLAWATLRSPNGAPVFLLVLAAFVVLQVLLPAARQFTRLPASPKATPPLAEGGAAAATAVVLIGFAVWVSSAASSPAASPAPHVSPPGNRVLAESVTQEIRVEEKIAVVTAKIRWEAEKGEVLPLLSEPAVLTRVTFPTNSVRLVQADRGSSEVQQLVAERCGSFAVEVQYEVPANTRDNESGFDLAPAAGLVNRVNLTVVNADVDVLSPQLVSLQRNLVGSNTVATLALSPADRIHIGWKPRTRDVRREKAVFYAEVTQLYVPAAGVVEGGHYVSIRPAQGELTELVLEVPAGATITDVVDPAKPASADKNPGSRGSADSLVSLWRFDPDTRKLRVTLKQPQSRPFGLLVRSQVATGPLPFEQSVALLRVNGAAGDIGLIGIATGTEVQLDAVMADSFAPINLEDFPGDIANSLRLQFPTLAVRRAFRYSSNKGVLALKASAVEPDVRVETQDTLSLGEDRTVLALTATADITRAGIFRLSFPMPAGFDVESISGSALSHWTESKTDAGRVITLHLVGKTDGRQQFDISLAGPGVKAARAWAVPQVLLREASKQRGTLLVVPEQGMRLQVSAREGVTQLDPSKSQVRQKGVLAFRELQSAWKLLLDIEQVEPWIQVTSLQHATVNEAQVKVVANLQYQIENTGLKALRVCLPTNAEGVRFLGDQVADYVALPEAPTNGLQAWEVKLRRRVIGTYLLQAAYQTLMPDRAEETALRGVQAVDVNLQRGFVTVQSAGRLQVRPNPAPEALQPTEWQSIPRALQQDLQTAAANFAYRLVEPGFELRLKLERHEPARLLPARVSSIALSSAISDSGAMLTQVRLEMLPADKRELKLTLPKGAEFWFAFVNQSGVWPRRDDQGRILIPLEQPCRNGQSIPVELFYSCAAGTASARALDLQLLAPRFDLPLENITWRVSLSEKWEIKHWTGTLQLQQQQNLPQIAAADPQGYLQNEASLQLERTREAEELLAAGNSALEKGAPQEARRAFQAAYGLSAHDTAFNEDARVQLHNIKLQQALVGLNVRQVAASGDGGALGARFRDLRNRKEMAYTQQDAKDIIDRNNADENATYMRLAERLIQQQDAAVSSAAAIRAAIPDQGRVLTFKRAMLVDSWADLNVGLRAAAARTAPWTTRALILGGTLAILLLAAWSTRRSTESVH